MTFSWSMVSGPGTVTIANPAALITTATFSVPGTYVLRLNASDGTLSASDLMSVNVVGNQPPTVSAGPDRTIVLPNAASLTGSASDDGLPNPPGAMTFSWSMVSGPGTVTIANPAALTTTATFSVTGTYVLQLTASDGTLSATDLMSVTVNPPPPPGSGLSRADHLNTKIQLNTNLDGTTSSFTPQSNSLLVVVVDVIGNTNARDFTVSLSGGGLTFTERVTASSRSWSYFNRTSIFTAPVSTAAPMTITVNGSTTASPTDHIASVQAFSFTGYNSSSATGATASDNSLVDGQNPMTLSVSPASSSVVVASRSWTTNGSTDTNATPDTSGGWTEVYDTLQLGIFGGYSCVETQVRTGSTSTDVRWDDVNTGTEGYFTGNALAVEIKAAP
jgi:hypothetical protein